MKTRTRSDSQERRAPFSVTVGRTSVRIYPRPSVAGRQPGFHVADYSSGRRRLLWFTNEKEARAEATRIAKRINAGDAEGASMTGDDRRQLLLATEAVAPFGVSVITACELFAQAASLVGSAHAVVEAAEEFAKLSPASRERLPLERAVSDYLEAKQARGRSPRHLSDLRSRLGRFVDDHPGKSLGDFRTADLQGWLDRLRTIQGTPASAQTRRNFATVIGGLFEFHRRRGVIPTNPATDVERESVRRVDGVDYWRPEEAEALLRHAGPDILPALAVGLFCGCRTAELARLRWRDIDLSQGHVEIGPGIAKTASRRLIPIPDSLRQWLAPHVGDPDAPLWGGHPDRLPRAVTEAAQAASVRRVDNGARHSFVTYRVALSGDVARTALEAGNSPSVIHQHYRGLSTREQAEAYFGIRPGSR